MTSESTAAARDSAPTGIRATLRDTPPGVRYLLGGVLINQVGAFVQTFLVLYLVVRGFSTGQAGLALAGYSIGAIGGTLLGGELTHRLGPRATIVTAMTCSGLTVGLIPVLARTGWIAALVVGVGLAGLVTQAYRPAASLMLGDLMPARSRVMGFSMLRTALNVGAAVGPLLAAGLALVDWDLLFWVDAATALAYGLVAWLFLPRLSAPASIPKEAGGPRSDYGVVLRDLPYLLFLGSVLVGTLIYAQENVALPLMLQAENHPTAFYSALLALSSVVLILCELKITSYLQDRSPAAVGAFGTALLGLGAAVFGLTGAGVGFAVAGTVLFVLGVMVSGPMMFTHPTTFPDGVKARYIAAHQAVFGLGLALGPVLGVLAWTHLHAGVWLLCGVAGLIGGVLAWRGMRAGTS